MDRRTFFAAAAGGIAAGAVPAAAVAQKAVSPRSLLSTYLTNVSEVVGASFLPVKSSDRVLLKVAPRDYDSRTVLAMTEEAQPLGYLPTNQARIIAPLLQSGMRLEARVTETRHLPRPSIRLDVLMGT